MAEKHLIDILCREAVIAKPADKTELFAATEHEKALLRRFDSRRQRGCDKTTAPCGITASKCKSLHLMSRQVSVKLQGLDNGAIRGTTPSKHHFGTLFTYFFFFTGKDTLPVLTPNTTGFHSAPNFTTPDNNGKFVSGYVFSMGSGAISYRSRLQSRVAKSTVEAEYVALRPATAEAICLRMLLAELGHPAVGPTFMGEENEACMTIATTTQTYFRTRHIRIEYHFIREAILAKEVHLEYVPSADNPADVMTKPLRGPASNRHPAAILNF